MLQEVLQRYRAIRRYREGRAVFDHARRIFATVLPITAEILDRSRALLDEVTRIGARDVLHAAVVESYALAGICSYERDFDRIPRLSRTEPAAAISR